MVWTFPALQVLCYLTSIFGAGHGIAPVAYVLVRGAFFAWGTLISLGALSGLFLVLAVVRAKDESASAVFRFCAGFFLWLSWAWGAAEAGHFLEHMLLSAHFQLVTLAWLAASLRRSVRGRTFARLLAPRAVVPPFLVTCGLLLLNSLSQTIFRRTLFGMFASDEVAMILWPLLDLPFDLFLVLVVAALYAQLRSGCPAR